MAHAATMRRRKPHPSTTRGYGLIAAVYLLGLFIGALDTGIVTPCRTVIQNDLQVDDQLGVWLITIYTLAYAAAIPFMGKLADRHGRKYIYLVCVGLFGIGSLGCGLAQSVGDFNFLLGSRVVQAIGGGGIVPIATAEFGTAFPPEKRGMALGLVGGVYGIANVFGASCGSLILDIFGQANWQYIFYINIPICIFIILAGIFALQKPDKIPTAPIDAIGTMVLVVMVLSLLYGLRNLDFFDFANSICTTDVYPFLIAFVALLPVFILIERRAADPIINLSYFKNLNIVLTMFLSIVTGVILMGVIFIPQFAENATFMPSGKGGYWVILLCLFAGVGSPVSGKLIDKFGVKAVLGFGLGVSAIGAFFLAYVSAPNPNLLNVAISFILIGIGLGFVMGTPINYMMLENTKDEESNSALATLSLMRSIGTAVAPAIMVAFIAHSGALVQDRVMDVLPNEVEISALPYQDEISVKLEDLKTNEDTKDMFADQDFPDLNAYRKVEINMNAENSKYEVPDEVVQKLQDSDVTTIVENTKYMATVMFDQIAPDQIQDIDSNIDKGANEMESARNDMDDSAEEMRGAARDLATAMSQIDNGITAQKEARDQLTSMIPMVSRVENYNNVLDVMLDSVKASLPPEVTTQLAKIKTPTDLNNAVAGMQAGIDAMNAQIQTTTTEKQELEEQLAAIDAEADPDGAAVLQQQIDVKQQQIDQLSAAVAGQEQSKKMLNDQLPMVTKLSSYNSVLDLMPDSAKAAIPASMRDQLAGVKTTADLKALISKLDSTISTMRQTRNEMSAARNEILSGISSIEAASEEMGTTLSQLEVLKAALPSAFEEAQTKYLTAIDDHAYDIELVFQETIDEGFQGMFTLVGICSLVGLVVLMFYRSNTHEEMKQREKQEEAATTAKATA